MRSSSAAAGPCRRPSRLLGQFLIAPVLAAAEDRGELVRGPASLRRCPGAGRPFGAKVGPVAFSPNGKLLATGGDNEVQLWSVSTRRQTSAALTSTANGVFALAFSPDGTTLAAGFASSQGGFQNGAVQLWNVAANRRIGDPLTDNAGAITCMAFSPDGTTLVTGSSSGAMQLWNTAARELIGYPLAGSAGAVSSLAFSPDGATLASATADGTARLWNVSLATGSQIGSPLIAGTAPASDVLGIQVAFSPDGKTLATGSSGGLTASGSNGTLWNVAAHRETGRIIGPGINAITTITFSPDGEDLAAGYGDGTVRLWNTVTRQQTGPPLADATSSTGEVAAEAFSPDGTTLATIGSDGNDAAHSRVRLWNVAAHKETGSFALAGLGTPAFAPGGSTMAFGGTALQLWDIATHHSTSLAYTGSGGAISSLAFSPDGKILAAGGENDTVQLLDVTSSKQTYSPLIGGTVDIIQSMAFSPDGTILAAGSGNGSVQLWDLATSQRVGTPLIPIGAHLIGGFGEISSMAFSPDGKILAVGYGDGTVRLWDVGYLVDTLRRLCTQIGGSLTRTEWTQYVPQGPAYRSVCP